MNFYVKYLQKCIIICLIPIVKSLLHLETLGTSTNKTKLTQKVFTVCHHIIILKNSENSPRKAMDSNDNQPPIQLITTSYPLLSSLYLRH